MIISKRSTTTMLLQHDNHCYIGTITHNKQRNKLNKHHHHAEYDNKEHQQCMVQIDWGVNPC